MYANMSNSHKTVSFHPSIPLLTFKLMKVSCNNICTLNYKLFPILLKHTILSIIVLIYMIELNLSLSKQCVIFWPKLADHGRS